MEVMAQARAGAPANVALDGLPASATCRLPLPQPVTVLVTDSLRNPVAGALVTFTSRAGKLSPARARTDTTGRARVRWTLGAGAGDQRLDVVEKRSGQRVTGTVRAAPKRSRKR